MSVRAEVLVDILTELVTHRGLAVALAPCLDDPRSSVPVPYRVMVDIDHFKCINDAYRHLFGDEAWCGVDQARKANVKGKDIAARCAGEAFAALLPQMPLGAATRLAEKLRTSLAGGRVKRLDRDETIRSITVSINVMSFTAQAPPRLN